MELSRRDVLRYGCAGAATGLAGCIDQVTPLPGTDEGSYRRWLPAPAALPDGDDYQFFRVSPTKFVQYEDAMRVETWENVTKYGSSLRSLLDLQHQDVSEFTIGPGFKVGVTSLETETLADRLTGRQFSKQTSLDGFDIYANTETSAAVGLKEETIVYVDGDTDSAADRLQTVITTHADEAEQYKSASEAFGTLTEGLNNGHFLTGVVHQPHEETAPEQGTFAGAVGWGISRTFKKTESPGQWLIVFESESAAEAREQAVKSWAEASLSDVNNIKAAQTGKVVLVTGKEPTEKLALSKSLPTAER
ncbi:MULTISPECIES: hypothetical protein [unclassified Haladaptatus]|uniref:hypothetical protein n=1 Tax=unclassified Haladaptatus TaxID=2622732 RepID=UPI0023E77D16|nr:MULTISPECIES: hypothetical protein [unclassified Haladaptatus]